MSEIESKVPAGPIESDPLDFYRQRDIPTEIQPLLREALEGIELGAYDERLIEWASFAWDQPTMVTVVSWIMRARTAGPRMTNWIPQLRTDMGPNDDVTCFRCDKPTDQPNDKYCVHCALDLGYAPIGNRDPNE